MQLCCEGYHNPCALSHVHIFGVSICRDACCQVYVYLRPEGKTGASGRADPAYETGYLRAEAEKLTSYLVHSWIVCSGDDGRGYAIISRCRTMVKKNRPCSVRAGPPRQVTSHWPRPHPPQSPGRPHPRPSAPSLSPMHMPLAAFPSMPRKRPGEGWQVPSVEVWPLQGSGHSVHGLGLPSSNSHCCCLMHFGVTTTRMHICSLSDPQTQLHQMMCAATGAKNRTKGQAPRLSRSGLGSQGNGDRNKVRLWIVFHASLDSIAPRPRRCGHGTSC